MAEEYIFVPATGVIVPDTSELRTTIEDEYRAVFGADVVVIANTPQGVLITAETIARANVLANNAALANQINPNLAGGVFLDAIWALTDGQRLDATRSTIAAVTLGGQPSTFIPAGTIAAQQDGTQWETTGDVTLDPTTGLTTAGFQAVDFGPIACNAGALNVVVSGVLGWESVTNANAAVLGRDEESDGASRIRRRNTLALYGSGGPEAIISALYDTEGVRSLSFRENVEDTTQVIDGISMVEHSIYACVDGGTDLAVATTLQETKSMGSNYNGGTSVDVTDPSSGQVYAVTFDRPTPVPMLVRATVRVLGATGDPVELTTAAILAFAAGEIEGEAGFTVGSDVSPFELAGAVNIEAVGIYVQKMEICTVASGVFIVEEVPIALDEIATITEGAITVIVL